MIQHTFQSLKQRVTHRHRLCLGGRLSTSTGKKHRVGVYQNRQGSNQLIEEKCSGDFEKIIYTLK